MAGCKVFGLRADTSGSPDGVLQCLSEAFTRTLLDFATNIQVIGSGLAHQLLGLQDVVEEHMGTRLILGLQYVIHGLRQLAKHPHE